MKKNNLLTYVELANEKSLIKDYRIATEELGAVATVASHDKEISFQEQLVLVSHITQLTKMLTMYSKTK